MQNEGMPVPTPHRPKSISIANFLIVLAVAIVVSFVAGTRKDEIIGIIGPNLGMSVSSRPDFSALNEVYDTLKDNFDGKLDNNKLIEGAKKGMVAGAGDDYTVYLDKTEAADFKKDLEGDVGAGIGVEIGVRNDKVVIVRTLADNPAQKAGVLAGDIVLKVNDEDVTSLTAEAVSQKVRGDAGTSVKLTVMRGNDQKDFTMVREQINNPSVDVTYNGNVAIMRITRFDQQTGDLAYDAAKSIKAKGVNKVIVDLRGNGGGYVTGAQEVLSLWLTNSLLFTEKSQGSVLDETKANDDAPLKGVKTVVLVDGSTASASEMVAGALQHYKVATLVGETTFGKGSMQSTFDTSGGGLLKVTIARWYLPGNINVGDKGGIKPNIEVKLTFDDINKGNDKQLNKALELLK
ncbi:S41 family peptidase [Candidatus Saccharibacteria bacterium]|nr:S41 family peptidase [Candidatus Saccharibacteria bacterium]